MKAFNVNDLISTHDMKVALDDEMFDSIVDYEKLLDVLAVEFEETEECL